MVRVSTKYLTYTLLGALAYGLMAPPVKEYFGVKPYTNVEVQRVLWADEGVYINATFYKNGQCDIKSFAVIKFFDGIPRYAPYKDLDSLPQDYNREQGQQGLNILVEAGVVEADYLELRTRHLCRTYDGEEEVINKIFSTHPAGVNHG